MVNFFCAHFGPECALGELLGLKWGDIDWNQKFIRVERSYKRGRIDKTKTGNVRRVDMSDQLADCTEPVVDQTKARGTARQVLGEPVPLHFPSES
jgi:integrase